MNIKPIRTEEQYDDMLERIFHLMKTKPALHSSEGDELDLLVTLAEAWEAIHYPMTASNPVAFLKSRMAQSGIKQADLIPFIGDKTQVSKVLNGKRELTLPMIKRLSKGLHIPIGRLVGV